MCGFEHINVQSTLGISFRSGQPYAIMPFMDLGDVRAFILSTEKVGSYHDLYLYPLFCNFLITCLRYCPFAVRHVQHDLKASGPFCRI